MSSGIMTSLEDHAAEPSAAPPPERPLDAFVWGLAQPALGLQTLLRNADLSVRAIAPVVALLLVCAVLVALRDNTGLEAWLLAYYATIVAANQISPIVFAKSYAKLASDARPHLDLPRRAPYLRSYGQALVESLAQLVLLGIGIAPLVALVSLLPVFGWLWAALIGWLWLAHWIVIEALDTARSLDPALDPEQLDARAELLADALPPPWYAAPAQWELPQFLTLPLLPLRLWVRFLARLGRRWRSEVAIVEARPWLAAGFGLGATILLAIPILNLLVRPAIVIAASHVLGRLEGQLPELESELEDV